MESSELWNPSINVNYQVEKQVEEFLFSWFWNNRPAIFPSSGEAAYFSPFSSCFKERTRQISGWTCCTVETERKEKEGVKQGDGGLGLGLSVRQATHSPDDKKVVKLPRWSSRSAGSHAYHNLPHLERPPKPPALLLPLLTVTQVSPSYPSYSTSQLHLFFYFIKDGTKKEIGSFSSFPFLIFGLSPSSFFFLFYFSFRVFFFLEPNVSPRQFV